MKGGGLSPGVEGAALALTSKGVALAWRGVALALVWRGVALALEWRGVAFALAWRGREQLARVLWVENWGCQAMDGGERPGGPHAERRTNPVVGFQETLEMLGIAGREHSLPRFAFCFFPYSCYG